MLQYGEKRHAVAPRIQSKPGIKHVDVLEGDDTATPAATITALAPATRAALTTATPLTAAAGLPEGLPLRVRRGQRGERRGREAEGRAARRARDEQQPVRLELLDQVGDALGTGRDEARRRGRLPRLEQPYLGREARGGGDRHEAVPLGRAHLHHPLLVLLLVQHLAPRRATQRVQQRGARPATPIGRRVHEPLVAHPLDAVRVGDARVHGAGRQLLHPQGPLLGAARVERVRQHALIGRDGERAEAGEAVPVRQRAQIEQHLLAAASSSPTAEAWQVAPGRRSRVVLVATPRLWRALTLCRDR